MKRFDQQNQKIIESQDDIIKLQTKVMENKEEELRSLKTSVLKNEVESTMQTTVETELKCYSSVLSKTCSAAQAPKKIQAAVPSSQSQTEKIGAEML